MSTTPAGPTLSGRTNRAGDSIVQTGSGMVLTEDYLIVLQAATDSNNRPYLTYGSFAAQVTELQRDGLLTTDETPGLTTYGREALKMAGWV